MRYVKIVLLAMLLMLCMWTGVFAKAASTPTPSPTKSIMTTGVVKSTANLRSGPGTTYKVVGSAKAGSVVTIVKSDPSNKWYLLDSDRWIAASLVNTSGGTILATTPVTPTITPVSSSNNALTTTPQPSSPIANKAANLRSGPGTNYAVVGNVKMGQALVINARNEAGDWYQLADGAWIAAFLVNGAPATSAITIAQTIPPPPTAAPASAAPAEQNQSAPVQANPSIVGIGQDLHGRGWRFKVSEIHKRKAVYFYDDAYVAMGYFLVVIIDGVNEQSGTDYFDRQIDPYLTDDPGNAYQQSPTGTTYATWQYGGIASTFTDVNPGNFVRIAMVFDLPPATGRVMLSTDLPGWIDLGNFSSMKVEDQ